MKKNRTYFSRLCAQAAYCLLVAITAQAASAATVRGRLVRRALNGVQYPASGVAVTLYNQNLGRSSPAYSGADDVLFL
jgi:hypothetical protein